MAKKSDPFDKFRLPVLLLNPSPHRSLQLRLQKFRKTLTENL